MDRFKLQLYEQHLATGRMPSNAAHRQALVAIELDRHPANSWGSGPRSFVHINNVCTLRTGNDFLWILGKGPHGVRLSRCMHALERLSTQGFPPDIARFMTKQEVVRATGNASFA